MGRTRGFLTWQRELPACRPVAERLQDHREIPLPQPAEQLSQQAGRCMDCGVPFCISGCPLGNLIPDFNDLVHRGRWREAYLRLAATSSFPEFTGRICPAPCEAACVLALNRDAVTIENIEKQISERAFAEGWVQPQPPRTRTGRRVAVVGSGPAGLAAAALLNSRGHQVTVHEAAPQAGGLLRFGVPDYKLEKHLIDRRLELLRAEGVELLTDVAVGEDPTWDRLHERYDAVLIAIGARRPRELEVPGRELAGVHLAMDYLGQQNRRLAGLPVEPPAIDAAGRRVIILGGGDTGADCLGTALRQGARDVRQIELLPQPPDRRAADNPWPQWPLVQRSSSAHEEGGARDYALLTRRLEGEHGALRRLHAVRVDVIVAPTGLQIAPREGETVELEVDLLLLAMGFTGPETEAIRSQLGVELDAAGRIAVSGCCATSVDGVFAAGDARLGASLVVHAIADGRRAAEAIHGYLQG